MHLSIRIVEITAEQDLTTLALLPHSQPMNISVGLRSFYLYRLQNIIKNTTE